MARATIITGPMAYKAGSESLSTFAWPFFRPASTCRTPLMTKAPTDIWARIVKITRGVSCSIHITPVGVDDCAVSDPLGWALREGAITSEGRVMEDQERGDVIDVRALPALREPPNSSARLGQAATQAGSLPCARKSAQKLHLVSTPRSASNCGAP